MNQSDTRNALTEVKNLITFVISANVNAAVICGANYFYYSADLLRVVMLVF